MFTMLARWLRCPLLPALALLLGTAGCEPGSEPTAVAAGPEMGLLSSTLQLVQSLPVLEEQVSATIDSKGGQLKAGGHTLTVPRGAVDKPTLFTMKVLNSGYIDVDLSATRTENGQTVKVGTSEYPFLKPLQLKLSYALGTGILDPSRLVVAYMVDGTPSGKLEGLSSTVDILSMTVTGRIDHFSRYAVGEN